jgi:predicted nuclease of predicted toxin-antitoxin system
MPRTIQFHLDENCDPAIAEGLRRHGIDVTTTTEAGLLHASDESHTAYAFAQVRVIFTQDKDFLRIHARGVPHAGIAYCAQQARTIGEIISGLVLIWEVMEPADMAIHVEFL